MQLHSTIKSEILYCILCTQFREMETPWIDLCSFDSSNEIVAYSEYPVMMDESMAMPQENLSREAFGGKCC